MGRRMIANSAVKESQTTLFLMPYFFISSAARKEMVAKAMKATRVAVAAKAIAAKAITPMAIIAEALEVIMIMVTMLAMQTMAEVAMAVAFSLSPVKCRAVKKAVSVRATNSICHLPSLFQNKLFWETMIFSTIYSFLLL